MIRAIRFEIVCSMCGAILRDPKYKDGFPTYMMAESYAIEKGWIWDNLLPTLSYCPKCRKEVEK